MTLFCNVMFLVDAFTDEPFKGNPAGVCIVDAYPSDEEMQRIASYYGWAEISFIKKLGGNNFFIRWFSPNDEAPICGHATMAASHVLFSKGFVEGITINYEFNSGQLTAVLKDDEITLDFPARHVTKCKNYPFSVNKVIGTKSYKEVVKDDLIYIIVLNTKEDVYTITPNFEEIKKVECRAIAVTAPGDENFDMYSRYFPPRIGINEDQVCGSMHCRLACYWHSVTGKSVFKAFQASKRTGILGVEYMGDRVKLSGKARSICEFEPNWK